MKKKIRFDKDFVREKISAITTRENFAVYNEIREKVDDLPEECSRVRGRIKKNTDKRFKEADALMKSYDISRLKMEKLEYFQKKRRRKYLEWVVKYINKIEKKEKKLFLEKYSVDIDMPGLPQILADTVKDEEWLFLDEVDSLEEESTEEGLETNEEVSSEEIIEVEDEEVLEPIETIDEEISEETEIDEESASENDEGAKEEKVEEEAEESEREEETEPSVANKVKTLLLAKVNS